MITECNIGVPSTLCAPRPIVTTKVVFPGRGLVGFQVKLSPATWIEPASLGLIENEAIVESGSIGWLQTNTTEDSEFTSLPFDGSDEIITGMRLYGIVTKESLQVAASVSPLIALADGAKEI